MLFTLLEAAIGAVFGANRRGTGLLEWAARVGCTVNRNSNSTKRKYKGKRNGHIITGHSVRVHAELAVVDCFLIQTVLQPLHHWGCCCQTKQTLRDKRGESRDRGGEKGVIKRVSWGQQHSCTSQLQGQVWGDFSHSQIKKRRLRAKPVQRSPSTLAKDYICSVQNYTYPFALASAHSLYSWSKHVLFLWLIIQQMARDNLIKERLFHFHKMVNTVNIIPASCYHADINI